MKKAAEMVERSLNIVRDSFVVRAGEKVVDLGVETGKTIINFNSNLQHLQQNHNRLSHIASDVEKTIMNQELHGRKKRKREVEEWLERVPEVKRDLHEIGSRLVDGGKVLRLNERVEELIEQSQNFGELLVLDAFEARGEPFLKTKLFGQEFQEVLDRIWVILATHRDSRIGIHGISGVGKTALAKHIHNRLLEETEDETEDRVYWVRVSQDFNVKKLQDEIAKVIGLPLSREDIEEKRALALHQVLTQRKNFVLILDDVREDMSLERVGFPLGVDGCRVIITTQSLRVCHWNNCQETFELHMLDFDGAWNLFKETFGNVTMLYPPVEEIAQSMTRKSGGLPQTIITMAKSMRGVNQIQEWRHALEGLEDR